MEGEGSPGSPPITVAASAICIYYANIDLLLSSLPSSPPPRRVSGGARGQGEGEYIMLMRRASAGAFEGGDAKLREPRVGGRAPGGGRGRDVELRARAHSHTLTHEHPEGYLRLAHAKLRRYFGQPRLKPRHSNLLLGLFRFPLSLLPLSRLFCAALSRSLSAFLPGAESRWQTGRRAEKH